MIEVLLVSDDDDTTEWLIRLLKDKDFILNVKSSGGDGINAFYERRPHFIVLAASFFRKPTDSVLILQTFKQELPFLPVIMIFDNAQKEKASIFKKYGAFDFIERTFCFEQCSIIFQNAINHLKNECSSLLDNKFKDILYVGEPHESQKLKTRVIDLAFEKINLIVGGKGAKKSYIAELLYNAGAYKDGPFIVVDKSLDYEKTLFGYEIDSGEVRKIGALEKAHKGVLYIENVEKFPKVVQKKLLDYCRSGKFLRGGSSQIISTEVKIIFGSTLPYYNLIEYLYPDFLAYLWINPIILLPLKDRASDIKEMIEFIAKKMNVSISISNDALNGLQSYEWPFNIQELELFVQNFILKEKSLMSFEDLPDYMMRASMSSKWLSLPFKEAKHEFEKVYIQYHVLKYRNNMSYIANVIGLDRTALYRKMKTLGIESKIKI